MKRITLAAAVAVALSALLAACTTPLAGSLSTEDRAAYEAACAEARGVYSGWRDWEVPTCVVTYQYPAVPAQRELVTR